MWCPNLIPRRVNRGPKNTAKGQARSRMALEIKAISGVSWGECSAISRGPIGTKQRPNQQECCPQPFRHRTGGQNHQALADLTTECAARQDDGEVSDVGQASCKPQMPH